LIDFSHCNFCDWMSAVVLIKILQRLTPAQPKTKVRVVPFHAKERTPCNRYCLTLDTIGRPMMRRACRSTKLDPKRRRQFAATTCTTSIIGEVRSIQLNCLEFLAAGIFGDGREAWPGSTFKWTGDSHRYGIYRNPDGTYKNGIVVLERHGGGMFGYAFDSPEAGDTWEGIAASFRPEMVWNICRQMAKAYHAARQAERPSCTACWSKAASGRVSVAARSTSTWFRRLPPERELKGIHESTRIA
jgi:hypothetical protein